MPGSSSCKVRHSSHRAVAGRVRPVLASCRSLPPTLLPEVERSSLEEDADDGRCRYGHRTGHVVPEHRRRGRRGRPHLLVRRLPSQRRRHHLRRRLAGLLPPAGRRDVLPSRQRMRLLRGSEIEVVPGRGQGHQVRRQDHAVARNPGHGQLGAEHAGAARAVRDGQRHRLVAGRASPGRSDPVGGQALLQEPRCPHDGLHVLGARSGSGFRSGQRDTGAGQVRLCDVPDGRLHRLWGQQRPQRLQPRPDRGRLAFGHGA